MEILYCIVFRYLYTAVAYQGGHRGRVAPGGTSEGAALSGKCGQIYVKKATFSVKRTKELKIRGGTGLKGPAEGAAQFLTCSMFIVWMND